MKNPLMTVNEVADYLGKCVAWVYRNQLFIPGYYKIGKSIFFNRQTFMKYCAGNTPPTKNPNSDTFDEGVHGLG